MKTKFGLFIVLLLGALQSLGAQIYFFDATRYADENDSSGKHIYKEGSIKVQFSVEKKEVLVTNGDSQEILYRGSFITDVEITPMEEYTNYFFVVNEISTVRVMDYKDSNKEDDLIMFDNRKEELHLKGKFNKLY